jgi:hypothetical protein
MSETEEEVIVEEKKFLSLLGHMFLTDPGVGDGGVRV